MSLEEFDVDLFGGNDEVATDEVEKMNPVHCNFFEIEEAIEVDVNEQSGPESTPTVETVSVDPKPEPESETETEFNHLDEETQNLLLAIGRVGIEMRKMKARQKRLKGELEDLMEQLQYCGLDSEEKENEESTTSTKATSTLGVTFDSVVSQLQPQSQQEPSYQDSKAEISESEWRSVPLEKLVDIASSTIEKLKEANVDTLGELEDLRAKISNGKAEWPKGIGPKKVDAIENAVIDWFTKHPVAGEDCETVSAEENVSEKTEEQVLAERVQVLRDAANYEQSLTHNDFWTSGNEAYGRGDDVTHCPYVPSEERDDWIRGWLSAEKDNFIDNV